MDFTNKIGGLASGRDDKLRITMTKIEGRELKKFGPSPESTTRRSEYNSFFRVTQGVGWEKENFL